MARRSRLAFAAAVLLVAAVGAGLLLLRSSEPSTDELIQTLVSPGERSTRVDAASKLAEPLDPVVAARVARRAAGGGAAREGLGFLTDEYVAASRSGTDAVTRRGAIRCLARIDEAPALNAVVAVLIADGDPGVRDEAVTAVGQMPRSSARAAAPLVRHRARSVDEKAPQARQIERALVKIGAASVEPLLPLVPREKWALRVLDGVGPAAVPPLRARMKRGGFRSRLPAAYALLAVRRSHPAAVESSIPAIVTLMFGKLGTTAGTALSAGDESRAIDVLVQVGRPAVGRLVKLARSEVAAGHVVKGASSAVLTLVLMGETDRAQVEPLLAALRKRDDALVEDVHPFYLNLGIGERELIGVLNRRTDVSARTFRLVSSYVTSGNPKLASATHDWARRNGASLTTTPQTDVVEVRLGQSFPGRTSGVVRQEFSVSIPTGRSWNVAKLFLREFCKSEKHLLTCS